MQTICQNEKELGGNSERLMYATFVCHVEAACLMFNKSLDDD